MKTKIKAKIERHLINPFFSKCNGKLSIALSRFFFFGCLLVAILLLTINHDIIVSIISGICYFCCAMLYDTLVDETNK